MSPSRPSSHGVFDSGGVVPDSDRWWLGLSLGMAAVVSASYLLLYPYPAHGSGLYLAMAEAIRQHGYRLPRTIPHYTATGIPYAYPPLVPYLVAILRDATGVGFVTIARYLPSVVTGAYLVPYYYLAEELLESKSRAGIATVLLAVTPVVLKWHLAAGGIIRSPAFLFTLTGLYAGVEVFKSGDRRWLLPSVVLFALTLLTHPVYATLFAFSYLLLFVYFDRSTRGLRHGVVVAIGGVALAAPWWLQVVSVHGPGIFVAAAGTHAGLGGGLSRIVGSFVSPLFSASWPFYAGAFAGAVYLASKRRFFVPLWLVATGYLLSQNRFLFVSGAMAASVLLVEVVIPKGKRIARETSSGRVLTGVLLVCFGVAVVGGGMVTTGKTNGTVATDRTLPAPYIDDHDEQAMKWVTRNTVPSARFVVLGDAAEWFPLLTNRTSLISPWGVEWKGTAQFEHQKELFDSISACGNATCLTRSLDAEGMRPEYVYVPKGRYTVRRDSYTQSAEMRRTLAGSVRYRLVFENRDVMIFRVTARSTMES